MKNVKDGCAGEEGGDTGPHGVHFGREESRFEISNSDTMS